ncbi:DMT family transporter [Nonomuraea soli]|uniref:DME family drug/metabolite transporter n=1 Tax=Nonomuraea soli TaxID=1032476 RepID=A0A7W0CMR8_9ACTN|nr:EamA family transporter [Nonomuraea soli]MBA2893825.1 DME family drug/metabolite transporter [Nonomuraea soli]
MSSLTARRGALFICVAAAAWGTGGAAGKLLFEHGGLDAVGASFWRYLLGAGFLLLVTRTTRRSGTGAAPASGTLRHTLVVGAGMAIYQTAYFGAIAESGVAVATVVTMGATTLFAAAGSRVFLGERLGGAGLIALPAALSGLVMLTAEQTGSSTPLGIALALLSAAGYAAVTLYTKSAGHHNDPATTTAGAFAVGALCLAPFATLPHVSLETVALLLYLGAIPTALAYALFFRALTTVRASTAAILSLGEAVGAAALGTLLLGEPLTLLSAMGGAVLLASVVVLTVQGQR